MDGDGPAVELARAGMALAAAGAAVDLAAGAATGVYRLRGARSPAADRVQDAGAASLALGIGAVGVGGALAAGTLRRDGIEAPSWAGWTAAGIEIVGISLVLANPALEAAGLRPMPGPEWPWEQVKLIGVPLVVLQADQVDRCAAEAGRERRGLLDLSVAIAPAPGGLLLTGGF